VLGLRGNLDAVGGAKEDGLQHSHGLVNLTEVLSACVQGIS
jgi:hypothetical protein